MRLDKGEISAQSVQSFKQHELQTNIPQTKKIDNNDEKIIHHPIISKEDVLDVIEKFNNFIEPLRTDLKFKFHDKLNEYYVEVINPITNETIKEIPSKKMLDMYADMAEFMGILVDRKI